MTIEANVSEQDDIDNATALSNALAILTLITGEPWDKAKLLATNLALKTEAAKALSTQGMTRSDAATLVDDRWAEYEAHELPAAPPPQAGFRTAMVSDQPVAESQTFTEPLTAPSHEALVERAKMALERRKAERAALLEDGSSEKGAVSSSEPPSAPSGSA